MEDSMVKGSPEPNAKDSPEGKWWQRQCKKKKKKIRKQVCFLM